MHFEALRGFAAFAESFAGTALLPAAFALAAGFFPAAGFATALNEQFLLEQRPSRINEPHSQNSAKHITPFGYYIMISAEILT